MIKLQAGKFRNSNGWLRQKISKRNVQPLAASGAIDDELWILLEYISEVETVGNKFLLDRGISRRIVTRVFKHFRGYIRQAKSYYNSAKILHSRSAGLLYYYCFLNLAKAAVLIQHPEIGGKRIGHGISCLPKGFPRFKTETIKILDDGIFPLFYKWYFSTPIRHQSLNVQSLFNYCSDISYQCTLAGFGNCKLLEGYYVHVVDKNNHTGWPLIGIADSKQGERYRQSIADLYKNFEQVELPLFSGREYFKMDNSQLMAFTFFQSKQVFNWISDNVPPFLESRDLVIKTLGNLVQANYFDNNFDYYISLPYLPNRQIAMDETIAIYLIMYYLSNLVRYNPGYLEELLSKKESWLIDSFVRSCSLTFLRSMISRITNTDYIIGRR